MEEGNCHVCDEPGELVCCDACPKEYHKACADLRAVPRGAWICPECRGGFSVCSGVMIR